MLQSAKVTDPLGMLGCAPISDGAAAVVIFPLEYAKEHTDSFVRVSAVAQASDILALF